MLETVRNMSIALYVKGWEMACACKARVKAFMEDERGLSGIVVAVMLILIAVLLIGVFWNALSGWLKGIWKKVVDADTPTAPQWT